MRAQPNKTFIVGIAGGSGSGKTTLAQEILQQIPTTKVNHITHDSYYRDQSAIPFEKRGETNYDHPDSLETELLIEHLTQLKRGESVIQPTYDFSAHNRSTKTRKLKPKPIILLEGILILADPELRELIDLKLFVDTEPDLRLARRLVRDVQERGRTYEFGIDQFLTFTKPMHDQFVEPSKKFADLIIPEGGLNPVVNEVIRAHVERRMTAV